MSTLAVAPPLLRGVSGRKVYVQDLTLASEGFGFRPKLGFQICDLDRELRRPERMKLFSSAPWSCSQSEQQG